MKSNEDREGRVSAYLAVYTHGLKWQRHMIVMWARSCNALWVAFVIKMTASAASSLLSFIPDVKWHSAIEEDITMIFSGTVLFPSETESVFYVCRQISADQGNIFSTFLEEKPLEMFSSITEFYMNKNWGEMPLFSQWFIESPGNCPDAQRRFSFGWRRQTLVNNYLAISYLLWEALKLLYKQWENELHNTQWCKGRWRKICLILKICGWLYLEKYRAWKNKQAPLSLHREQKH